MKKINVIALMCLVVLSVTSCTTVSSGHKGVEISWGGKTNLDQVYPEGMNSGIHWVWDDIVEYDVREKTLVKVFEFNDKNNMSTRVELSLDYNLDPSKVNLLHVGITDIEVKILKTLKSAGKEVVPQYSAVELNITKRAEAEDKLSKIIAEELPEFFVEFARIQMTDVDIPNAVADLAEQTAVQLGRNELANKLEAEKVAKAKALVAEAKGVADAKVAAAKGEFQSAEYQAKTRKMLSTDKMLDLQRVENERIMAEGYKAHGKSFYGENNVFGVEATTVVKGLSFGK